MKVIAKTFLAILVLMLVLVGCEMNQLNLEPEEMFNEYVENLRSVESYTAIIETKQDFGGLGTMESEIVIYENVTENSFYYLTSLDGEEVMEIYQLDNIFSITFNIMGDKHTETFVDDEFEQVSTDILIMDAFQELDDFSDFDVSEDRSHYILKGDTAISSLVDNEILSLDDFNYDLESSIITLYVNKRKKNIEKVVLETIMVVDGERITSKTVMEISDINKTNNIKEMINN